MILLIISMSFIIAIVITIGEAFIIELALRSYDKSHEEIAE